MTEQEAQYVRDLQARIIKLEHEARYLRLMRDKARTERDRYKNTSRFLHGILILAKVRLPVTHVERARFSP